VTLVQFKMHLFVTTLITVCMWPTLDGIVMYMLFQFVKLTCTFILNSYLV